MSEEHGKEEKPIVSNPENSDHFAYDFLIKEYEKTADVLLDNLKSIERIANNYKYFTAGLLSVIVFVIGMVKESEKVSTLIDTSNIKFFIFILLPLLGIIIGVSTISSMMQYRRRDSWCYARMNLIRKILLSDQQNIIVDKFKEYTTSRYGRIEELQFSVDNFMRHEWRYNARIVEAICAIWIALIVCYFYTGKFIVMFTVVVIIISLTISGAIYKKILENGLSRK